MADPRPLAERPVFVLILGGLSALTAISIDIMLPATGLIAGALGAAPEAGGLLVGSYLLAYGVGQLFWGLFSDAFGRRPALILSLSGFILATILCALATSFWWLIALRALQGLMGGAPVIARALARDVGSGETAARLFAVIMAVTSVAPLTAPVIGSALIALVGWRACFWFLVFMGVVLMGLTLGTVRETVPHRRPERFSLRFLLQAGRYLLTKRAFLAGMLFSGLTFAGYASVLALGAVVMESTYGLSPAEFAAVFAFGGLFAVTGSLSVRALLPRLGLPGVARVMAAILALAVAAQAVVWAVTPPLPVFWACTCLYFFTFGLGLPTTQAIAMEPARDMAGFASSILGAALMAFGGAGAALAMALYDGSLSAISGTITLCGGAALLSYLVLMPRRPVL